MLRDGPRNPHMGVLRERKPLGFELQSSKRCPQKEYPVMRKNLITRSKHFVLHQLAEGIFAAVAEDGGSAISNSGVIDLGEQILVFDTFLTPQAAIDLRQITIDILKRTPRLVINSHYHNDHIWGNQVFALDAQIVSSTRTRALIATAGAEEFRWYSLNSAQRLESLRAQYQNTNDEQQQKQLLLWIGYYEGLVEALPHLKVCMPSITFSNHLEIHGAKHTSELITFEGAHTENDTVLYLSKEGIVYMSDLLFVGCHPYLADGDPLQLLKALRELNRLDATYFIPGHGPVGRVDDLKLLIEYIEHCLDTAQLLVDKGNAYEDKITELKIAERYVHWQQPQFYQANIRFLCERMSSPNGGKQAH
jgi:cyclase